MKIFKLNGKGFNTLNEFFDTIGELLVENNDWGKNWDALNDILYGGFIKTDCEEEFKLIWLNSEYSKINLTDFQDIVDLISEHKHITLELK
ncbi:barstar family protein [Cellulophaga tyrosinoxydans]|uniref:Barstar (Barnase inhibitor) n=1 Tax=Cellulophaga tyrosinoxydans TaxID=504486 RepID=A0A1W2CRP3_9FLAO|nr:barstar family protein [Cellulophaga tyrosinoxydans]SMC87873.1 Barstar (barnase inhibitor) [Cellulophaga tyrosinoxydans]